jgi:hypothetical protein
MTKGQLISKCPFGVLQIYQKPTIFLRISALILDLFLEARAEILKNNSSLVNLKKPKGHFEN